MYDLPSENWINTKGTQTTQSVKRNEMYKWKDDMKYTGYELEQLCAQGECEPHHKMAMELVSTPKTTRPPHQGQYHFYQMLGCGISCNYIGWHENRRVWQVYYTDKV